MFFAGVFTGIVLLLCIAWGYMKAQEKDKRKQEQIRAEETALANEEKEVEKNG